MFTAGEVEGETRRGRGMMGSRETRLSSIDSADFVSNRAVRNNLPDNEVISLLPQSRCLRHKKRGKTGTCVER